MASTASFSPNPQSQFFTTIWTTKPSKPNNKPYTNLHFLSNPTTTTTTSTSSFSFPINLKSTSTPLHFHPLQDSIDNNFVENQSNLIIPTNQNHQIIHQESTPPLFIQDPPWIASLFLKGLYKTTFQTVKLECKEIERRKYNILRRRQVKEETEAWERTVSEYRELEREMCEKKLAPNLPYVKGLFLGWFESLREAIEREQEVQRRRKKKRQMSAYAPHIELLPADKMAVIVMHKMMGLVMAAHEDGCVLVVQAAIHIGMAVENEVRIHSFLEKTKSYQRKKIVSDTQEDLSKEKEILRKRVNKLIRRKRLLEVQKLVKNEETKSWSRDTQAKLGCRLIELLTETAYVQPPVNQSADSPPDVRPAFRHRIKPITKNLG